METLPDFVDCLGNVFPVPPNPVDLVAGGADPELLVHAQNSWRNFSSKSICVSVFAYFAIADWAP